MKKISIYLIVLILMGSASCKKFLETTPTDFAVPEQYYNTESQLTSALAGVYASLAETNTYGLQLYLTSGGTDAEYYRNGTGAHPSNFNYTSGLSTINNMWNALYDGVNQANNLLANINKPSMDAKKRAAIKGETLFLRAFIYYRLVSLWGDVPLLLEPTVDSRKGNNPKVPAKDIYNQIIADMTEANALVFPYNHYNTPSRISKSAVQGVLARVCLSMAGYPIMEVSKYQDAKNWADSVIQNNVHKLNPDYSNIFITQSQDKFDLANNEVIWEIDFYGNNTGGINMGGRWSIYGTVRMARAQLPEVTEGYAYGYTGSTPYLYKLYQAGDIRRDWTMAPYSYQGNNSLTKIYKPVTTYDRMMGKWRRDYEPYPRAIEYSATNFPMLRYADVLLMFAEAESMIGGTPSTPSPTAVSYVNMVRRRGFGKPVNTAAAPISVVSALTLSTTGNTGYVGSVNEIPVTFSGGGGTGATGVASVHGTSGKVTGLHISNGGSGYTSAPTVTIGTQWTANTPYSAGQQVAHLARLYTVKSSGTSSATPPTHTTGTSAAATTGVEFTYAGLRATATANIATSTIEVSGLSPTAFQQAIREERARELSFEALRKQDLIRWGIYIPSIKEVLAEMLTYPSTATSPWPSSLNYVETNYGNAEPKHEVYPIPESELATNRALEQHPLWK